VPFPRRLLQRSSQSGEECSGVVLEPRWNNLQGWLNTNYKKRTL
jgi:hypothetical protein